jgi:hypothetical protein
MSLIVRGLTQGKLVVPVYYKKSSSLYDTKAALDAPAMFQKNVTILVGQSVRIVSVQPDGPSNDPSNALTPLSIGSQRQYRLLDENDAIVPTQFWSSSNSYMSVGWHRHHNGHKTQFLTRSIDFDYVSGNVQSDGFDGTAVCHRRCAACAARHGSDQPHEFPCRHYAYCSC